MLSPFLRQNGKMTPAAVGFVLNSVYGVRRRADGVCLFKSAIPADSPEGGATPMTFVSSKAPALRMLRRARWSAGCLDLSGCLDLFLLILRLTARTVFGQHVLKFRFAAQKCVFRAGL